METAQQRRLFTADEYYRLADVGIFRRDDRVELLDGDIVEMTPIGSRHAACVDRLLALVQPRVTGRAILRVQNPIRLSPHSEPQPDLSILKARADFYASAHPAPGDVLLVIEVADSSRNSIAPSRSRCTPGRAFPKCGWSIWRRAEWRPLRRPHRKDTGGHIWQSAGSA